MSKAHAILSPSAAYRWKVCTPSARFEEQIPEKDNPFSGEGTIAHDLAALILESRAGLLPRNSQKKFNQDLNKLRDRADEFYEKFPDMAGCYEEMFDCAEEWADLVCSYLPMTGKCTLLVEQRVDMTKYVPLCYGTTDAGLITPKVIYVMDYKYGRGKRVSAKRNSQMMLYAVGLLTKAWELGYDPTEVVLVIHQPRIDEGKPSTYTMTVDALLDWVEEEIQPAAKQAIGGQGDFVAGAHCDFCKAKTSCMAYFKGFEELANIRDKRTMSEADMLRVVELGDGIATWVKKVKDETRDVILAGRKFKGLKVVAGRKKRSFKSEDVAIDELLGAGLEFDDMYKTTLRGITDLEAFLGKKRFADIMGDNIAMQEEQAKLVVIEDDRDAIDGSGADIFNDEYEQARRRSKKTRRRVRR